MDAVLSDIEQLKGAIQNCFNEHTDHMARVLFCEDTGAIGFTQGRMEILMDITFEVKQLCNPA